MFKKIISALLCIGMMFCLTSCGDGNIATVDGEGIEKGYFDYYFNQLKTQLQNQLGEGTWETVEYEGKTGLEFAKERALQSAIDDAIITKKAQEDGIKLTTEDESAIDTLKNQWIQYCGSRESFVEMLKGYGITESQFDYMADAVYYRNHLVDKYAKATDDDAKNYYDKNVVKVKHVLIMTIDPNTGESLSEEKIENAKKLTNQILDMAKSGSDFDALVAEYTEDQDVFYYVGEGFSLADDGSVANGMVTEFENASFALNVGEVSDVVESTYGYHIIKRYENDAEMYENAKVSLQTQVKESNFTDIINGWRTSKKIVVNESLYNSYK